MKVTVVYDEAGSITTLLAAVEEFADQFGVEPEEGESVIEVDADVFGGDISSLWAETESAEAADATAGEASVNLEDFKVVDGKVVRKAGQD